MDSDKYMHPVGQNPINREVGHPRPRHLETPALPAVDDEA